MYKLWNIYTGDKENYTSCETNLRDIYNNHVEYLHMMWKKSVKDGDSQIQEMAS